ncbi:Hsp20/alpha crystallin family protein [Isoptericola sp. b441]|uniref:Hsp20/alpha crystallin family protein n=1 Tax=Actinotalea lenta TaxID=3064654 RepID=A0ABT9DCK0_9CELL|nr:MULTISPECIES: Hsp20/alpha crystallin family protein [unclassified Isoptericola]MDO8108622.1 Hsp20/alpha crystallin family protein [Isoptericola sp. b441]MDO8120032.1 Hsp20/alpha crystallin family protein [Isoptericola sp. b490]
MATRMFPFADPTRLMDEVFGTLRDAPTVASMPMDLYRTGDHYLLNIDLPGADPGSVDVAVEDRTLTIRAERSARTEPDVQWLAHERPTGTYVRQLNLGRGLALDRIEASYSDGVLSLTIPVAEEAKPRKIEIQHAASPTSITAEASH